MSLYLHLRSFGFLLGPVNEHWTGCIMCTIVRYGAQHQSLCHALAVASKYQQVSLVGLGSLDNSFSERKGIIRRAYKEEGAFLQAI